MDTLELNLTDHQYCQPLAARMRPTDINHFYGQQHLLGPNKPLTQAINAGKLHSMILWGPPGTGKTTLAKLIAQSANARFESLSAVFSGVKDIRAVMDVAKRSFGPTILFIDEIHRFNKAQQDAFLPYVEDGTVTLIGATTENPSFELNNALLSRARVYVLKRLDDATITQILQQAIQDPVKGFGEVEVEFSDEHQHMLVKAADGDARRALNLLEVLIELADHQGSKIIINEQHLQELLQNQYRQFDKGGDIFYDQISALHKSVRGSDPDAALYWFARMIDGGCDPKYIARRVVRMATEDIGIADPRALTLALQGWETFDRLGSPEGELAIAQAIVYCACCAKSNAVYAAYGQAMQDARTLGTLEVPMHLRNAPTSLAKDLGHGKDYRYAHDEAHAYAAGERYFPDGMPARTYYEPVDRGLETKIREKLAFLKGLAKGCS